MAFDKKTKEELRILQERSGVGDEETASAAGDRAAEEAVGGASVSATSQEEYHEISEVFDDMMDVRGPAWPLIAVMLIILYPIGIFMIIIKINRELQDMKKNSRIATGIGAAVIALALLFAILALSGLVTLTDRANTIGIAVFLLIIGCFGGVVLIRKGIRSGKVADMNARYKPVILDTPDGSVDAIAAKCGESYEECYQNLKTLIVEGFIPSAKLKKSTRCLVVRKQSY